MSYLTPMCCVIVFCCTQGKRVGFSGTPSDLLPEELGRCDYETGDDGMMLTTVLDRRVASYELLPVRLIRRLD